MCSTICSTTPANTRCPARGYTSDAAVQNGRVALTIKNISREPIGVPANELTERFVRGDASRTSEGSGLGLSIAKSLMELQKGELTLEADGDLFKASLYFTAA